MADINGVVLTVSGSPTVSYTITYTRSRPSNSQMKYNFTISAALGSSGSYLRAGYGLLCTITINGVSASVRMKQEDNDNWEGTTPRVRTLSLTTGSTTGNATQGVRFRVVSDGRLTLSAGTIDNSAYTVLSLPLISSAAGAPTACSVSSTLAESNVTLSWSGATAGTNNTISSYEVQVSESTNNSTWGSFTALTTVTTTATSGSVSVAPPSTRGSYRRFQVRTRGSAGSSYYSGWKVSTNSVRRNTLATPPTSFTALPFVYITPSATLSWSGTVAGTSAIKNYVIQQSTSPDNTTWGTWEAVTTVTSSATSGSYTATPTNTAGVFTRYRIAVTDTLNAVSSYVTSNSIKKNTVPETLTITAPHNGSATYNANPRYLIQVGADGDQEEQTLFVYSTSANWKNSVDHPEFFCRGGTFVEGDRTIFRDANTPLGSYTVKFESHDEDASSATVSRTITVLASPFEEIVPNVTHVKASQLLTIRTAVNTVRNYYGLSAFVWSKPIVAGITEVRDWVFHITEIRTALDPAIDLLQRFQCANLAFTTTPFAWIPLSSGRPNADVMNQIQALILDL